MQKQISIVIATWNAADTLRTCLNSIVPQLTDDIEIIIIDGGSSDATNEIIQSFGDRIAYTVSEKDKGIYDAWNKGVRVARGKWIAFIGADDVLLPGAISSYVNIIKTTNNIDDYDYICAHNEYINSSGTLLKLLGEAPSWNVMRRGMAAAHVASLHSKHNLFETIGDYDLSFKICADYDLLLRKRDRLKYIFIDNHIAQMKVGGMSFSKKAIKECFYIRKKNHSVSSWLNWVLYMRDLLAFQLFKFRKHAS